MGTIGHVEVAQLSSAIAFVFDFVVVGFESAGLCVMLFCADPVAVFCGSVARLSKTLKSYRITLPFLSVRPTLNRTIPKKWFEVNIKIIEPPFVLMAVTNKDKVSFGHTWSLLV
jgi:hypothetical protein